EIKTLEADVARSDFDAVQKTTKVFQGRAKFLRPDRASLYLQLTTNPQIYEHYVYTGTYLYEYRPQSRLVRIHEQPAIRPGQAFDDNFLGFLIGMKAVEAKQRYELTLAKED